MGANATLFLKMAEQDFLNIPENVRAGHLIDKIYKQEDNDFDELMKDDHYKKLYKEKKTISKALADYTHHLREQKRKQLKSK